MISICSDANTYMSESGIIIIQSAQYCNGVMNATVRRVWPILYSSPFIALEASFKVQTAAGGCGAECPEARQSRGEATSTDDGCCDSDSFMIV